MILLTILEISNLKTSNWLSIFGDRVSQHLLVKFPCSRQKIVKVKNMKAVLQRVLRATVRVEEETIGHIGVGLLVFLCVEDGDDANTAAYLAGKIARMRIFSDYESRFNLSLLDTGGEALVVSQFTLAANWRKGNRPSFSKAAAPELAKPLYGKFCTNLSSLGIKVKTGLFAAHMAIELENDGPVTIWMDSTAP